MSTPQTPKRTENPPQKVPAKFAQASFYQGVIPNAEEMERYAGINPDLPMRIIKMAEDEGISRRGNEKSIIRKSFTLDVLGTICGLVAVGLIVWLCYQFITKGFAREGAWVAGTVIVALAVVFVLRKMPRPTNK